MQRIGFFIDECTVFQLQLQLNWNIDLRKLLQEFYRIAACEEIRFYPMAKDGFTLIDESQLHELQCIIVPVTKLKKTKPSSCRLRVTALMTDLAVTFNSFDVVVLFVDTLNLERWMQYLNNLDKKLFCLGVGGCPEWLILENGMNIYLDLETTRSKIEKFHFE